MAMGDRGFEFRLPASWPRRVRATVVHARSAARVALTAATGSVGETTRLRQDLALLREELHIKDTRMEGIPPHRRSP
jgi:hypothetical protein